MMQTPDARTNMLLAALPEAIFARWSTVLEPVYLPLGEVLYEPGGAMPFAYFPTSAIVAMLYITRDGEYAEVGLIGNEGVVGVSLFMSGRSTQDRAVVQSAGIAFRLRTQTMVVDFERADPVRSLLLRYTQALISQIEQTAVCNRLHNLDQQLCRWLLMSMDRQLGEDLLVTQEQLAHLLGVRRESVTAAAMRLRNAQLIRYTRGHIQVLDREGLEQRVCECYGVVKNEYAKLLGPCTPSSHGRDPPRESSAPTDREDVVGPAAIKTEKPKMPAKVTLQRQT